MRPSQKTWGYVYIVKSRERCKIGYTGDLNKLEKRLNRLHHLNAYGIKPLFIIKSRRAFRIERELHRRYGRHRVHGEWFELPHHVLEEIRNDHYRDILYPDELNLDL